MMASISLSWITSLHSTGERDLEENATGCHFSSAGETWDQTAPVAKSELSASMRKGLVGSGKIRTGAEVTLRLRPLKADCSSVPQCHFSSFLVRSNRSRACWEKSWMKRRSKLVNPRKDCTSFLFVGSGH